MRPEPAEFQLPLLDAVALLWRMHLRGLDVGNRWAELADLYEKDDEDGFYAFNDMHAMLAFAATGRSNAAATRLAAMKTAAEGQGTNATMLRLVGVPISRAVHAFGQERYGVVVDFLMPVRYRTYVFGGSHAQRDVVQRTLNEAALRNGDKALAIALSNERTSLKPHCPFSWRLHERATAR